MSDSKHSHNHHNHDHHRGQSAGWKPHRDWRVYVAVVLMLGAMLAYVMSDDESLQPGGGPPAAPVPAAE